jgi:predicted RNA-binding Zn-ribbon protein involved in translation (DUF1610 family)
MIFTVDSNVLLSIFTKDSLYKKAVALLSEYNSGEFIINEFIYLELGVHFQDLKLLDESLETLEVRFVRQSITSYDEILKAWTRYLKKKRFQCPNCGKIINPICPKCNHKQIFRQRILTDFLIGGFASANSNGILTFDPGYYKNYFPQLIIIEQ